MPPPFQTIKHFQQRIVHPLSHYMRHLEGLYWSIPRSAPQRMFNAPEAETIYILNAIFHMRVNLQVESLDQTGSCLQGIRLWADEWSIVQPEVLFMITRYDLYHIIAHRG